jgi:hypothetical protein
MISNMNDITETENIPSPVPVSKRRLTALAAGARAIELMKRGVWVYFILIIIEGALRKWILPGFSTPLLIIRDPVAVWLLIMGYRNNKFPSNIYVTSIFIITALAIITALLFGHGNLGVALYGARILIIHFPLMFLIGKIFAREDVIKLGRVLLWLSLPMIVLIALQFYSPQSAFVNRGVGGDRVGGGFAGALGFFRPPGTFSFTSGNTQFFSFVCVFVIYFWLNPSLINRFLLIASTIALLASVPLSISRTLIFQVVVSMAFVGASVLRNPKYFTRVIGAGLILLLLLLLLSNFQFFQTSTKALVERFTSADDAEGGLTGVLGDRFLGGLVSAVTRTDQPFFGYGIGMGTNAGAKILNGEVVFLISEEEWGRLVGEMGTLFGLSIIFLRVHFCYVMLRESFKKVLTNDLLPWMLLSWGLVIVAQSQWAQPTTLGFSTLIGGLILATVNKNIPILN